MMAALQLESLTLLVIGWSACAQVYEIRDRKVPDSGSLEALYAFYVYDLENAPDKSTGDGPSVSFEKMEAHVSIPDSKTVKFGGKTVSGDMDVKDYKGLQISLIELEEFWKVINPESFCSVEQKLELSTKADKKEDVHAVSDTIPIGARSSKIAHQPLKKSGIYYLVVSNCGEFSEMTMNANVVVKNPHGYLPANEYHKMTFFIAMTALYLVTGVIWTVLSCKYSQNLIGIQYSIAVIIALGLFECLAWFIFLSQWNATGTHSQTLLALTLYSSTAKRLYSFMLVLVASMGWGVTRPTVDTCSLVKIFTASTVYFVASLFQELVLFFRHSLLLKTNFLAICSLPVSCWCAILFFWIFKELSDTIVILSERRETEKHLLFTRFRAVLIGIVVLASLTVLFQVFDTYRSASIRWYYQWFPNVGVSHLIFYFILVVFVYLWAPHSASDVYAYSEQLGEGGEAEGTSIVHAVDGDDEEDAFDLKGTSVVPETIGVGDDL